MIRWVGNAMDTFVTLSTEIWRVSLPGDWTQANAGGQAQAYFESADGTRGAYFSSLRRPEGQAPVDEVTAISAVEVRGLHSMPGQMWVVIDRQCCTAPESCRLVTDAWDRASGYRIVSQLVAAGPWIARMSLHDYRCPDYLRSKQSTLAILDSFQLNE